MGKAKGKKLKDPTMGLDDYGRRSLMEAYRNQQEVEKAPLSERAEARLAFGEAMRDDPALVAERIGWMIDGNYGHGESLKAKQIVASPRMNRRAALTHLVGVYEWKCPGNFAVDAWKKLNGQQKQALDAAVDVVIEAAEQEMLSEQGG